MPHPIPHNGAKLTLRPAADEKRAPSDIRIDLAEEHRPLVERVARLADECSWRDYLHAPELPELEPLRRAVATLLWERHGIALLRIGDALSDDAMRLLLLLVGRALGRNIAPTVGADERPLFAVTAMEDPTLGGEYGGNARNARSLALHTDGSGIHTGRVDVLGMLCLQPAQEGGVSRFADVRAVQSQLADHTRIVLKRSLPRADPYNPHLPADRLICRPVFDRQRFSYHPDRIREGIRLRDGGAIAPPIEQALSELDAALERAAVEIPLARGDIVLLDNGSVAHGRTAFAGLAPPRLIERLWVEVDRP